MRIILKIIAAPFVLALTLTVGVLSFIFSLASWAFNILCLLCAVTALFAWFVGGDYFGTLCPEAARRRLCVAAAFLLERGNIHGHDLPKGSPHQQGGNHRPIAERPF